MNWALVVLAVLGARERVEHCTGWDTRRLDSLVILTGEVERGRAVLPDTVILQPGYETDEEVIAHEMLHILIGRPGHPVIPFVTCGLERPE